jgi:hypothetical protein
VYLPLRNLRYSFRRSRHDADLRAEIEAHRTLRQDALERGGLDPDAAAQASLSSSLRVSARASRRLAMSMLPFSAEPLLEGRESALQRGSRSWLEVMVRFKRGHGLR